MARNIFKVEAYIVDANGTFNFISGYPKMFDSKNYNGDIDKTLRRAQGDLSEAWGAFCKRDDRMIQVVTLSDIYGNQLEKKSMGDFIEVEPASESGTEEEPV